MLLQRGERGRGEVVVVHLHADFEVRPATLLDLRRQKVHRVPFRGLNIVIRISDDVGRIHETGAQRPIGVLSPAEPDRLAVQGQQHRLMDIKGPAVVSGQPVHVGRVRNDKQLQPGRLHCLAGLVDTALVFVSRKTKREFNHQTISGSSCVDCRSRLQRQSLRAGVCCNCRVLHPRSGEVTDRDVSIGRTPPRLPRDDVSEFAEVCPGTDSACSQSCPQFSHQLGLRLPVRHIKSRPASDRPPPIHSLCAGPTPWL
jgi:hypothetical protein